MTRVSAPPPRLSFGSRRRRRRWPLAVLGVLVSAALLVVVGPWVLGAVRADALPGTRVAGVDVGGLDEDALRARLTSVASELGAAPIVVERGLVEGRAEGAPRELVTPVADAGYRFDVDATAERVLAVGRHPNPLVAWREQLASFRGGTDVAPIEDVDGDALRNWAEGAAADLAVEPIEGTVAFDGAAVNRTDPEPGMLVDADALADRVRGVLLDHDRPTVEAPLEAVAPVTTIDDVDAVAADAQRVVSGPITLNRGDVAITLSTEQLAALFEVRQRDESPRLTLHLDPERLRELVPGETIAAVESDPVEAEVRLVDGAVTISESATGFRFDAERAAAQVHALATGAGPRTATLEGEVLEPDLSTEDARALEIVEPVASFTTHFEPGQSRVTNIRLMAELIDGAVLRPGETFSVNEHVGPRTEDKGFVGGGAILEGRFVEQIGGGVSQFATTMYNAAYFGGYELVEYQAHSYYISRYPMGREATLNYPTIDLKIRNSSPYGLLVATSSTESSVTVTMWGRRWVEVESITGEPFNRVPGEVRDGFDVTDVRVLRYPDGREEREERFTRYRPEDETSD